MLRSIVLMSLVALGLGCAAAQVALLPGAEKVVISNKPPQGARVGPIVAVHGKGCGLFGRRGNRDGALAVLKNRAVALGADWLVIKAEYPPYDDPDCYHDPFVIEAIGYRSAGGAPSNDRSSAKP